MPSVPNRRATGQPPGWGDADGAVIAVELMVTATVGGLMATIVVPTGRLPVGRDLVGPGLEAGDVEVHDQGGAGQPVEVRHRTADRDQHAVHRELVRQRVVAPTSRSPAVNVRVAGHRPDRDRDLDRVLVDRDDAGRQGEGDLDRDVLRHAGHAGPVRCPRRPAPRDRSRHLTTRATCGLTVTDSISNPAAGVPVTIGLTGSVLVLVVRGDRRSSRARWPA